MRDRLWFVTFRRDGHEFDSEDHYRVWASTRKAALEIARDYLRSDYGPRDAQTATLIDMEREI